jgi:hypothetical protein
VPDYYESVAWLRMIVRVVCDQTAMLARSCDDLRDVATYLPRLGTYPKPEGDHGFKSFPRTRGAPLLAPPRRLCLISTPYFVAHHDILYDGICLTPLADSPLANKHQVSSEISEDIRTVNGHRLRHRRLTGSGIPCIKLRLRTSALG